MSQVGTFGLKMWSNVFLCQEHQPQRVWTIKIVTLSVLVLKHCPICIVIVLCLPKPGHCLLQPQTPTSPCSQQLWRMMVLNCIIRFFLQNCSLKAFSGLGEFSHNIVITSDLQLNWPRSFFKMMSCWPKRLQFGAIGEQRKQTLQRCPLWNGGGSSNACSCHFHLNLVVSAPTILFWCCGHLAIRATQRFGHVVFAHHPWFCNSNNFNHVFIATVKKLTFVHICANSQGISLVSGPRFAFWHLFNDTIKMTPSVPFVPNAVDRVSLYPNPCVVTPRNPTKSQNHADLPQDCKHHLLGS